MTLLKPRQQCRALSSQIDYQTKNRLFLVGFLFILIGSLARPVFAQTYTMRTVVKDFVTTEWTLECPDGEVLDMSVVDLTEQGIVKLLDCLNQIESEQGIQITSKTVVEDFVVESDEVIGTVEMTAAQVDKIKNLIENNRVPVNPFPATRPRIQSVLLNGVLDSFIIDLGNGCILDLTDVSLDPQTLNELIQLLQQLEAENGVHVSGATTVKDGVTEKDRVVQISYLTPQQIQRIFQFFQQKGIALLLNLKWAPVFLQGVISLGGEDIPIEMNGHILFQPMPPDPQHPGLPFEVMELQLQDDALSPLVVSLAPQQPPALFLLHPVDFTGKLNLFESQMPNLRFDNVGPDQVSLVGHPDFPHEFEFFGCGPWPFHQSMPLHSLGRKRLTVLPGQPNPNPGEPSSVDGFVQIEHMELGLPLRLPVIPGGLPAQP